MSDRIKESMNQSQQVQRANLIFLLQTFARVAEAKERSASAICSSEITDRTLAPSMGDGKRPRAARVLRFFLGQT